MTTPVVAIFRAKAGLEDELEALFQTVIQTTLAEEGCISYQLNRDLDDPGRFVWTEEWESRELLQRHLEAPHITDLFAQVPEYIESGEVISMGKVAGGMA